MYPHAKAKELFPLACYLKQIPLKWVLSFLSGINQSKPPLTADKQEGFDAV